jgi:hypothetical protein
VTFIRNGQQKEAIRELAKEELKEVSDAKTTREFVDMVAKLFPAAKEDELLPKDPRTPQKCWLPRMSSSERVRKAVQNIKASGVDGISTQAFRALQLDGEGGRGLHRRHDREDR